MFKTWRFRCRGPNPIPGWGTKIPQAAKNSSNKSLRRGPLGSKFLDWDASSPPWLGAITWEPPDGSRAEASRFPAEDSTGLEEPWSAALGVLRLHRDLPRGPLQPTRSLTGLLHTAGMAVCAFVLTRVIITEVFLGCGITLPKVISNFEAFDTH